MTKAKVLQAALLATAMVGGAAAEADTLQLKLTSNTIDFTEFDVEPTTRLDSVEVVLTFDTTPEAILMADATQYINSLTDIKVTFFDDEGQPITTAPSAEYSLESADYSSTLYRYGSSDEGFFAGFNYSDESPDIFYNVEVSNVDDIASLYESLDGYPVVAEVAKAPQQAFLLMLNYRSTGQDGGYMVGSYLSSIEYIITDADGDGVTDALDLCEASIIDETVVLNGINSGVTNTVDANGCSVADQFALCDIDRDGDAYSYRGPTYCAMMTTYDLYRQGVLTYTEVRMLRNAL